MNQSKYYLYRSFYLEINKRKKAESILIMQQMKNPEEPNFPQTEEKQKQGEKYFDIS